MEKVLCIGSTQINPKNEVLRYEDLWYYKLKSVKEGLDFIPYFTTDIYADNIISKYDNIYRYYFPDYVIVDLITIWKAYKTKKRTKLIRCLDSIFKKFDELGTKSLIVISDEHLEIDSFKTLEVKTVMVDKDVQIYSMNYHNMIFEKLHTIFQNVK